MNYIYNDPLGALSKGISKATEAASKATENIKNNENLKASLQSAKSKGYQGF